MVGASKLGKAVEAALVVYPGIQQHLARYGCRRQGTPAVEEGADPINVDALRRAGVTPLQTRPEEEARSVNVTSNPVETESTPAPEPRTN